VRESAPQPQERPSVDIAPEPAPTVTPATGTSVDPLPWIVAGVGAGGVIAGIVLGLVAQGEHSSAISEPVHELALAEQQRAYDLATGANVAFIAGGTVVLIGVVWGIVSLATSASSSSTRAAIDPVIRF